MIDLMRLLPQIVGELDASNGGIVETFLEGVRVSCDATEADIAGLRDLISLRDCPEEFLGYLDDWLTLNQDSGWTLEKRRFFLSNVVSLYKAKGMVKGLGAVLRARGHAAALPITEYWKSTYNEYTDYSTVQDAGHTIKAARIGFADVLTEEERTAIEQMRPIHVLPFYTATTDTAGDTVPELAEEVSTAIRCAPADEIDEPDDGQTYLLSPGDPCTLVGLQIAVDCFGYCETSGCQYGCESGCAITCEFGTCETDCEGFCQNHCQELCEYACQGPCDGTCENACMYSCIFICQSGICQLECELICQTSGVEF